MQNFRILYMFTFALSHFITSAQRLILTVTVAQLLTTRNIQCRHAALLCLVRNLTDAFNLTAVRPLVIYDYVTYCTLSVLLARVMSPADFNKTGSVVSEKKSIPSATETHLIRSLTIVILTTINYVTIFAAHIANFIFHNIHFLFLLKKININNELLILLLTDRTEVVKLRLKLSSRMEKFVSK